MKYVSEDEWAPSGVDGLEPNALVVVRSRENCLVVAGPGAGKTELLAQRAHFLLTTGMSPRPQRILALSFKRDAAHNLEGRVKTRCGEISGRFDSMTIDAFAKSTVDRFTAAIPREWRPPDDYQVRLKSISADEAKAWLSKAPISSQSVKPEISRLDLDSLRRLIDTVTHGHELPHGFTSDVCHDWGRQWWREQVAAPAGEPSLSFPMLNRLAAYLLRSNPIITNALRLTYSHVFLDEFQDTTSPQWDLVKSAFGGDKSVLTAVGDRKQRIMVWAGAKTDVFEAFEKEFSARNISLVSNYRSVPSLVRMQHCIAQELESDAIEAVACSGKTNDGVCQILEFRNPEQEATYLAQYITNAISSGARSPRDLCVLVRQQTGNMIECLRKQLSQSGIAHRDESGLQDLRTEPLFLVTLSALRLATRQRDAEAWTHLRDEVTALSRLDSEQDSVEIERLTLAHKVEVLKLVADDASALRYAPTVMKNVLGEDRYRSVYQHYGQGNFLKDLEESIGQALVTSLGTTGGDVRLVVDDIIGESVVPAMTIHKSKGLEFQTVIFLGLEDAQWWGFKKQPDEEKRAFFVAFSRAIHQVIFTWCDERDGKFGRRQQQRSDVDPLHAVLRKAGVEVVNAREFR